MTERDLLRTALIVPSPAGILRDMLILIPGSIVKAIDITNIIRLRKFFWFDIGNRKR